MLSCDWAGGGIVSTLDDLLKLSKAFWGGYVVSRSFLSEMSVIRNRFRAGMHYGLGMMELRFQEFFFLLRGFPSPKGHSGILGTHLYYDAANDLHIVLNMGSNKKMAESIKLIIRIEALFKRGKS
jgi:D-alanyl-D-alanine carboxypeptidase